MKTSEIPHRCKRQLQRLAVIGFATFWMLCAVACRHRSGPARVTKHTSVPALITMLPNLEVHGIEACVFANQRENESSSLPSPSEVLLEVVGSADLSPSGSEWLETEYEWRPIDRNGLPEVMRAMLPSGTTLTSDKLNISFAENKTYAHGLVIVVQEIGWQTFYFMARDMDHPIN